jgi:hypothetical protein
MNGDNKNNEWATSTVEFFEPKARNGQNKIHDTCNNFCPRFDLT